MNPLQDLITIKLTTPREAWLHFIHGVNKNNGVPPATKSVLNEATNQYETVATTEEDHTEWKAAQQQLAFDELYKFMNKIATDNAIVLAEIHAGNQIRQIAEQTNIAIKSVTTFEVEG